MSLSSDSPANRCKCTATEHAENNGDPLLANKKACQAVKFKSAVTPTLSAEAGSSAVTAPRNSSKVSP